MRERFEDIWESDVDVVCVLTNGTVLSGRNIMGGGIAAQAVAVARADSIDLEEEYGFSIRMFGHTVRSLGLFGDHNIELLAFPTKQAISDSADLTTIRRSLKQLFVFSDIYPEKLIGLPRPGAGLGGLSWSQEVKPLLESMWHPKYDDRIHIFGYPGEN